MKRWSKKAAWLTTAALLLSCIASIAGEPEQRSIEGCWKLVEQHYGKGMTDLADTDRPLMLEFGDGLVGGPALVWLGEARADARSWPAAWIGDEPVPVVVDLVRVDTTTSTAIARYRVLAPEGDDRFLKIEEDYTVSEDGRTLRGTATVFIMSASEDHGSYILRRIFERAKP